VSEKNDQNALWLQRNSHNNKLRVRAVFKEPQRVLAFKKCHDAKFVLWPLKKMTTTRSGIMKIPQRVVVVSFYSHDVK
jgi:alpha-mannosidase